MSRLSGWYPQPDGRERYWDGELWSDSGPARRKARRLTGLGGAHPTKTAAIAGLVALALTALIVAMVASPPNRPADGRSSSGSTTQPAEAPGQAQAQAESLEDAEAVATAEAAKLAEAAAAAAATAAAKADPVASAVAQAKAGTALAAASALTVKGRAPKTGYSRDQFGQAWFDADRNGCDTRNDILRRDLAGRAMQNACKVMAGTLAPDPYTGTSIRFIYGGAGEVDIDHVVALSDAWQKGGATWAAGRRLALANDPLNLLAVDSSANRSKGDGDAATWLPPNKSYRCAYVARQVAVKGKYAIWVTAAERDAMTRVLAACPTLVLPGPGSAATVAALPGSQALSAPAPAPRPAPEQPAPAPAPAQPPPAAGVSYANCTAVRAAGAAPIHRGDPGYAAKLDRDGDGIGCE